MSRHYPPDSAQRIDLLRQMVRIRRFEERCVQLYSEGTIRGFLHLYIGEEAVAAGVLSALAPEDAVVSTYRDHGHALARGVPMSAIMAPRPGKRRLKRARAVGMARRVAKKADKAACFTVKIRADHSDGRKAALSACQASARAVPRTRPTAWS